MVHCILRTHVAFLCCAKTAGWVGLVQSLVLLIVSVLAIEIVTREREEKFDQWHILVPQNFTNIMWGIFYVDFLVDGYGRGKTLFYSMIAYVPLAIFWFFASCAVLCVTRSSREIHKDRG